MMPRGPLSDEQVRALLANWNGTERQLSELLQRAARMGIAQHRPGLLTDEQIATLVDLDTLCESGDHADLHGSYQAAASMGANLVLAAALRTVPTFNGPACYVCAICDSVRAVSPESIAHRGVCADIIARIKGTL